MPRFARNSFLFLGMVLACAAMVVFCGCATKTTVLNGTNFRSARVKVDGDCVVEGLRKNTFPTKLANVKITKSSKGKFHVTGRLIAVGEDTPIEDAEVMVITPAATGECLYHTGQKLASTNFKGQFDFYFKPEPREEILLYREGFNPQILKLPVKVVKKQVVKRK